MLPPKDLPTRVEYPILKGLVLDAVQVDGDYSLNGQPIPEANRLSQISHLTAIADALSYFPDRAKSLIAGQKLVRQHSRQGQAGIWYRYDTTEDGRQRSVSIETEYDCAHDLSKILELVDYFRGTGSMPDYLAHSYLGEESRTILLKSFDTLARVNSGEAEPTPTSKLLQAYGVTADEIGRVRDYDTQMRPIEAQWTQAAELERQAEAIKSQANQSLFELQQRYSDSPVTPAA